MLVPNHRVLVLPLRTLLGMTLRLLAGYLYRQQLGTGSAQLPELTSLRQISIN
jgi:hypothetical protein